MPPKQNRQSAELGQSKSSNISNQYASQFTVLLAYLRSAPKTVQEIFAPYVLELSQHFSHDRTLKATALHLSKLSKVHPKCLSFEDKKKIEENIVKMLSIQSLHSLMNTAMKKLGTPSYIWQKDDDQTQTYSYQRSLKLNLRRPGYELAQQIAKYQAKNSIGSRLKQQDCKESLFYKEPRFIDKLAELVHWRDNNLHRGEVALLEYTGNFILGKRAYVIAKDAYFELWQKTSPNYPYPFYAENAEFIKAAQDEDDSYQLTKADAPQPSVFELQRSFRFLGHSNKITCASLSQDQFYIITGSVDRTVKLWCLRLNILLATFKGHSKAIWDVHFNPSGLYFLSGGADGLMLLWKTDSSRPQRMFVHRSDIYKVHFGQNPSFAISAGEEGLLKIWDILSAKIVATIKTDHPIINFNLGHSGIYLVVIETDGRVTVHNTFAGEVVCSFYFYFKLQGEQTQKRQIIHDVCLSEDEKDLACVTNKHILLYSMQSLEMSPSLTHEATDTGGVRSREKKASPYLVLMSMSALRFNYCRFRHRNLLVVGGTSCLN